MRRRRFLQATTASGAVLLAKPGGVLAGTLTGGTRAQVAERGSRLFPGSFLVHADMHNHSLFSDGRGNPADAFVSMRDHGLDVAALTDHSVLAGPLGTALSVCPETDCKAIQGIDDGNWADTATLANEADAPDSFVAIRGFEWSSPSLGHMNVWFSDQWIDPERTAGLVGVEGIEVLTDFVSNDLVQQAGAHLANLVADTPIEGLTMAPFYNWLMTAPGDGLFGGGRDGIMGFNHPGRETGRFGNFSFDGRLVDRVVSLELFNRSEDYLFEGTDRAKPSPLVQCLDAGWRPGITGVTDEHGTDWGGDAGKGRAGIWVDQLSRSGVRAGMERRSFFATREPGLRVDAAANGVRMGASVPHDTGPVRFEVDLDKGTEWIGKPLLVQILRTGSPLPTVLDTIEVTVPAPSEPVISFTRDVARADGDWLVLRITDPDEDPDGRATGAFAEAGRGIAYTSPFYLVSAASGAPGTPVPAGPAAENDPAVGPTGLPQLPRTGGGMLAGGAALGAAAIAALAARRYQEPDGKHHHGHDHDHGENHDH